jgi:hypothetical protein
MANQNHKDFDTLGEFINYVEKTPIAWKNATPQSINHSADSFTGGVDWQGALDLSKKGWQEGRNKLVKELDGMKGLTATGSYRETAHDVSGYLPDVPRAIVGMPDCMFTDGDEIRKVKPVVKIMVSIDAHCRIKANTIQWRGAAVLSYIDQLEERGQRCEIWTYFNSRKGMREISYAICLKQAGEPLDIDRMAFCLVHPAFMRRLGFKFIETYPYEEFARGYGQPKGCSKEERERLGVTVYLDQIEENFSGQEQALRSVTAEIETQLNPHKEEA